MVLEIRINMLPSISKNRVRSGRWYKQHGAWFDVNKTQNIGIKDGNDFEWVQPSKEEGLLQLNSCSDICVFTVYRL